MTHPRKPTLEIRRRPAFGLVTDDRHAVTSAVRHLAEKAWTLAGQLDPEAHFFGEGWWEEMPLRPVLGDGGEDEKVAALVLRAASRSEVRHAWRVGDGWVREEGRRMRVIGLLELRDLDARAWTLHVRRVGEGEAGCGVLHGEWVTTDGVGADALPAPFRAWLEAGTWKIEAFEMNALDAEPPRPHIRASVLTVPRDVPATVEGMADLVGRVVDPEALRGLPGGMLVFALRGRDLERWEIYGELPCSADDIIRAIGAYSQAEALALVHPGVLQVDEGPTRRAVLVTAERDGHRVLRALALDFAPDGTVRPLGAYMQDEGEIADGWHRVAPSEPVTIDLEAVQRIPGGVIPEA